MWILTQGHIAVDSLEKKIQAVHQGTADLQPELIFQPLRLQLDLNMSKLISAQSLLDRFDRKGFGVFFSFSLKLKVNAQSVHCETPGLCLA